MSTLLFVLIILAGTIFLALGCAASGLPGEWKIIAMVVYFFVAVAASVIFGRLFRENAKNYPDAPKKDGEK